MNRYLTVSIAISMTLGTLAIPLRAACLPRAGKTGKTIVLWTNADLERLRALDLISIVGQPTEEAVLADTLPPTYIETQDPEWYAEQAAMLRDELERRQAQLRQYRQALKDVQSLKEMTGGVNLDEGDIAITPQAGIEVLQRRVKETQTKLDVLEDLAQRRGIPPGTLRGQ